MKLLLGMEFELTGQPGRQTSIWRFVPGSCRRVDRFCIVIQTLRSRHLQSALIWAAMSSC